MRGTPSGSEEISIRVLALEFQWVGGPARNSFPVRAYRHH